MTKRIVRRMDIRLDPSSHEASRIFELSGEVAVQAFARPDGVMTIHAVGPTENIILENVREFQLYAPQEIGG